MSITFGTAVVSRATVNILAVLHFRMKMEAHAVVGADLHHVLKANRTIDRDPGSVKKYAVNCVPSYAYSVVSVFLYRQLFSSGGLSQWVNKQ